LSKNGFSTFVKGTQKFLVKHSPEILTGVGIAGMATSTVLAVRATPKALALLEEKYPNEKPRAVPVIKATWKCYLPAAILGVTSAACIVGASAVHTRRNAALATVYQLSQTALTEYKDKVAEVIGDRKEQAVRDELAKDKVVSNPVSNTTIIPTGIGNTLCLDYYSGRYFYSDIDKIKIAVGKLNRDIVLDDYISLNMLYSELGLDNVPIGEEVGWSVTDGKIELDFSAQIADDGKTPCIVVSFYNAPRYNFSRYM